MILNKQEVAQRLREISYLPDLTSEDRRCLMVLSVYLDNAEPLLTFDEFNELFKCEPQQLDEETYTVKVTPKNNIYLHIDKSVADVLRGYTDGCNINIENEEHIKWIVYDEFCKSIEELKTR